MDKGQIKRIAKWILIWTAILFIPILAFGVLATILVAAALGATASGITMIGLAVLFFLSPQVLTLWAVGIIGIIIVAFIKENQRQSNVVTNKGCNQPSGCKMEEKEHE